MRVNVDAVLKKMEEGKIMRSNGKKSKASSAVHTAVRVKPLCLKAQQGAAHRAATVVETFMKQTMII